MAIDKIKRSNILWALVYVALTAGVLASICLTFSKQYYKTFWVSGQSMSPTLNQHFNDTKSDLYHRYEYGISDDSYHAKKNLERFDIVLTIYPSSWVSGTQESKIKRVWGLPGDTISLEDYKFTVSRDDKVVYTVQGEENNGYVNYVTNKKTFTVTKKYRAFKDIKLADNEYFVMGDNWMGSSDSYYYIVEHLQKDHIKFSDLVGVVICIEGTCRVENQNPADKKSYSKARYFI